MWAGMFPYGAASVAATPFAYEIAAEVSYPVAEEASQGVLLILFQYVSVALGAILPATGEDGAKQGCVIRCGRYFRNYDLQQRGPDFNFLSLC